MQGLKNLTMNYETSPQQMKLCTQYLLRSQN